MSRVRKPRTVPLTSSGKRDRWIDSEVCDRLSRIDPDRFNYPFSLYITVLDAVIAESEAMIIARWEARALARAMKPAAGSNGKGGRL